MTVEYDVRYIEEKYTSGITANQSVTVASYEIPRGYAGFVETVEVVPDLNADGSSNLDYAQLLIDSNSIDDVYFKINGQGQNMLRPWNRLSKQLPIPLGIVPKPLTKLPPRLLMTAVPLKEGQTFGVKVWAGASDVAEEFEVKWKLHLFNEEALKRTFGNSIPVSIRFVNPYTVEDFAVSKDIEVAVGSVDTFPAGMNQDQPRIKHWIRYAYNESQTTANQSYLMRNTDNPRFNFDLDIDKKTILIPRYIGVYPHDNHKYLWFKVGDKDYPRNYWLVEPTYNQLPFGDDQDLQGPYEIPRGLPYSGIHDNTFQIWIKDNGSVIPANGTLVALRALKIEL